MKKALFTLGFITLLSYMSNSQPSSWNYTITSSNHQIIVLPNTLITIDNVQIEPGDYIGVFFTNSSGDLQCAGYQVWNEQVTNVAAWSEDVGDDGFTTGEVFTWKIWDASANIEYLAQPEYILTFPNTNYFVPNGMSGLSSLLAVSTPWNFTVTSVNHIIIIPQNALVTLDGNPIQVGDFIGVFFVNNGNYYCGGYIQWQGNVTSVAAWMDDTYTTEKEGFSINENFVWKIWSIQNQQEYFAFPVYISTLPNQGEFQSNGMSGIQSLTATSTPVPWNYIVTSTNHTILVQNTIEISVDNISAIPGDYIGVFFNSNGTLACGGYVQLQGLTTTVAAWGSDAGEDGFEIGEEFTWKYWNHLTNEEYVMNAVYDGLPFTNQGNFQVNGLSGLLSLTYTTPTIPWNYVITGSNHSVLFPSNCSITIDGVSIENGDYVGVFYSNSGQQFCAGYFEWESATTAMTVWGDDSQTTGKDGFAEGESFIWKIWKQSNQLIYNASAIYMTNLPNAGSFATNGISGVSSLIALTSETQTVNFPQGWSVFSTYIEPFQANVDSVMNPIVNYIDIVKTGNGLIYWPSYGINLIGNFTIGLGYQAKLSAAKILNITGLAAIPQETPIIISSGWNIIGYLRKTPAPIQTIFQPIIANVIIVKDGIGQTYWPAYGVDNIVNMIPGNGYQMKVSATVTLTYPAN